LEGLNEARVCIKRIENEVLKLPPNPPFNALMILFKNHHLWCGRMGIYPYLVSTQCDEEDEDENKYLYYSRSFPRLYPSVKVLVGSSSASIVLMRCVRCKLVKEDMIKERACGSQNCLHAGPTCKDCSRRDKARCSAFGVAICCCGFTKCSMEGCQKYRTCTKKAE
jgi:hypothetical protein